LPPAEIAAATRSTIAATVPAKAGSSIAAWTTSRDCARYSMTGAIAARFMDLVPQRIRRHLVHRIQAVKRDLCPRRARRRGPGAIFVDSTRAIAEIAED